MRAVRVHEFGDPDVLRPEIVEDPIPGPHEVRVRLHGAGVNPVDTYVRSGAYERLPELPYIPGGDGAGVIDCVGEGVETFRPGDRVYIAGAVGGSLTGCLATLAVKKASQVFPLPKNVSFHKGAAIGVPYATAFRALVHKAEPRPGDLVLVHGASGGVGLAAVQLAVARGLRVAGTASSKIGRQKVAEQGAELVLDHSAAGYTERLREWSEQRGVDVVLEMAAHINLAQDLELTARFGRIVIVGNRGAIEINPRQALVKDLTVRGLALANATDQEMTAIHAALFTGLERGELKPVISKVMALEDAAEAHRALATEGSGPGKIVLDLSE